MRKLLIALSCLLPVADLHAQADLAAKFKARTHSFQNTTLPYRLFIPENYDPGRKYPLVLALHGSGERGSDNWTQVRSYRLATVWADPRNQSRYPCFVVAPQCPSNESWLDDFQGPIANELAAANDLLDSLGREFSLDPNRLYCTGLSMGGFGVWDLIQRFPQRFAAAVPMSAGGDTAQAARIAAMAIWNFHGALDDAVPVAFSRQSMAAFEHSGHQVVYTHCRERDCSGLPDSVLAGHLASHAALLYTEYERGGHVIWDESFDWAPLVPWVFDQYRQVPGAARLTSLQHHEFLTGPQTLHWTAASPTGTAELWYSPDAGTRWLLVSPAAPNNGSFDWQTEQFPDCAFGVVRLLLRNEEGFIYARDQSHFFTLNNSGNGPPLVQIKNGEFRSGQVFDQDTHTLRLLLGDPEQEPLQVRLSFSADSGRLFSEFESFAAVSDTVEQLHVIDLAALPNTDGAVLRVVAGDGVHSVAGQTMPFIKRTPRVTGLPVEHVAGSSGASVTANVVDAGRLTGHLYRVTFAAPPGLPKSCTVLDVERGAEVVAGATQLDGVTEGPWFDGLRLLVRDYPAAMVDLAHTGWESGTATLIPTVSLPVIDLGEEVLRAVPIAADYRLTIFDQVVDTSSTAYGATPVPMKFEVRNLTIDRQVEVIFLDADYDQTISLFDEVYFLDLEAPGQMRLTWALQFGGTPNARLPQPGDSFVLRTLKPLTAADVYEFRALLSEVQEGESTPPRKLVLDPGYPNPFGRLSASDGASGKSAATTLRYHLPQAGRVRVSVFNLLGQEIAVLFDGEQAAGAHALTWEGKTSNGAWAASGVFLCRVVSGPWTATRKILLLR